MKPPENPESQDLEECRQLLSSLSHSIPSARSFLGRWSAVSSTLDRLRPALDELAALPPNDLSSDLLRLLSQTLSLTLSLSAQCRLPDPPAGRLRTQSDLSSASSSLTQHAADALFLLRSAPLLRSNREARSLITRLQIGSLPSRIPALDSLISMPDRNVALAAAEGLVPALVRLLLDCASASHPEARAKAVIAIARVSSVETCRHLLVAEAAPLVTHLSRALVEPDAVGCAKEKACAALQPLTLQKDVAMTLGSGGTISVLLEICRSGTPSAQAAAACVLKNLTAVPELRAKLVEENAVPVLIRVLQLGTVVARENSASCLSNLIAGEHEQSIKLAVLQQGVLDCIRSYWDEAPAVDNRDLEPAIRLLRKLSSSSSVFSEMVLSSGFLPRIILALDSASAGTRTEAIKAVSELALVCTNNEGLEHAVPRIVRMVEGKGAEEKAAAAKALASLMTFSGCRRLMRKDEKGILNLMMLLDSSVCNVEKKDVVRVLLAAARSRRCRKLMVASGARGLLPWLESMEVEGAKKLSELLAKGKLLGVFPRN